MDRRSYGMESVEDDPFILAASTHSLNSMGDSNKTKNPNVNYGYSSEGTEMYCLHLNLSHVPFHGWCLNGTTYCLRFDQPTDRIVHGPRAHSWSYHNHKCLRACRSWVRLYGISLWGKSRQFLKFFKFKVILHCVTGQSSFMAMSSLTIVLDQ